MRLFWKTPAIFAREKSEVKAENARPVYLPKGTEWINFWTGQRLNGGQNISADAPIEICPLFVRAGALVPMGPYIQYASEKPADPIELRIYSGADGSFILYEDENDNYHYEQGIYSTIAFQWNDAEKTLTIGQRKGHFPGMLKERSFRIVLVRENHGIGIEPESKPDRIVRYDGTGKVVRF